MQNSKIIFIGGVQRSGTTFLRNSLIKSSDICIPYENGFYKVLQKKYINGLNLSNCDQFLTDLYKVKRFDFWELDRMEVMNLLKSQIPIRFNDFVIELLNFYKSKHKPDSKIIGLKNPHVYNHIDYVQSNFSNPFFF
jgi:hypothetical protein